MAAGFWLELVGVLLLTPLLVLAPPVPVRELVLVLVLVLGLVLGLVLVPPLVPPQRAEEHSYPLPALQTCLQCLAH